MQEGLHNPLYLYKINRAVCITLRSVYCEHAALFWVTQSMLWQRMSNSLHLVNDICSQSLTVCAHGTVSFTERAGLLPRSSYYCHFMQHIAGSSRVLCHLALAAIAVYFLCLTRSLTRAASDRKARKARWRCPKEKSAAVRHRTPADISAEPLCHLSVFTPQTP